MQERHVAEVEKRDHGDPRPVEGRTALRRVSEERQRALLLPDCEERAAERARDLEPRTLLAGCLTELYCTLTVRDRSLEVTLHHCEK